jgi:small ligand-binding sensory domain FIST
MKLFPYGHATHPEWGMAAELVLAQLRAQMASPDYASQPSLGLIYITDHLAAHAQDLLDHVSHALPWVTDWSGTVGVGIAANQVEYFDEPALAILLCDLEPQHYRVFSGVAPLSTHAADGFVPHTALLHVDGNTPDLTELIAEMAQRTRSGYVFGGLSSSRGANVQFAQGSHGAIAGQRLGHGVFEGGLSGVAFDAQVPLMSRVTQGCLPVAPERTITACEEHVLLTLDNRPALEVLLEDLQVSLSDPRAAMAKIRATLVGLSHGTQPSLRRTGEFGDEVMVRHLVGLDPERQAVAIAQAVEPGMRLTWCQRHASAARADLLRIGAEIRESLEPETLPEALALQLADPALSEPHPARRIAGAIYVSCAGRGGPHFGSPSAELQLVRRALGDVPLVGFFAGGEIAHQHVYGYTGVLTVFTSETETAL